MSTDGAYAHATAKTFRPNIQLDKTTLSKLNQLSYRNEALANCMCRKLQDHAWGWDTAKELCEKELEGRKQFRIEQDAIYKEAKRQKEKAAREEVKKAIEDLKRKRELSKKLDAIHKEAKRMKEKAAREQIRKAIETDKKETERKVALDQEIKKITTPKRVKLDFIPKVREHAYCVFCDSFHPTVIEVGLGDFRNYSLDSYHVSAYMTVDNEGYDRKPTDRERCINAFMVDHNRTEDEAERKCDQLLSDPLVINRYLRNPKLEKVTKQSKQDLFVADMVSKQNIHPSIAQTIYEQDQDRRTQYMNWLLSSGRLSKQHGKVTASLKPVSQLERCIREKMLDENLSYDEAKEACEHGEKHQKPI